MGYIIRAYHEDYLVEQTTPNVNNRVLDLHFNIAHPEISIVIPFEVWNNVWTIRSRSDLVLSTKSEVITQKEITEGDVLYIEDTIHNRRFTLLIEAMYEGYSIFNKYKTIPGKISIGSRSDNHIVCDYRNMISGHHAYLHINESPIVEDNRSSNGVFVNGKKIVGSHPLRFGDLIDILGLKIMYLDGYLAINTIYPGQQINGLEEREIPESERTLRNKPIPEKRYSRSPRQILLLDDEVIEIEPPPAPNKARRQPLMYTIGPSITMVIPMVVGVLFTNYSLSQSGGTASPMVFMGIVTSITAATIGAFWAVTNYTYQRRIEKEDSKLRNDKYRNYLAKMRSLIEERQAKNRDILNTMYPDLKACLTWVKQANRRIWERNINHTDFLTIRLGVGERDNPNPIAAPKERFSLIDDDLIEEPRNIKQTFELLREVPICISLLEHRLVGVISDTPDDAYAIAKSMITQISAFHAYTDVKIALLYRNINVHDEALKWLPHVWSPDEKIRLISHEKQGITDILYFLSSVMRERIELNQDSQSEKRHFPHYVIFITDPELIEDEVNSKILLSGAQELGISTVLLYQKLDKLPNHCTVIIQNDREYQGYYSLESKFKPFKNLSFDQISEQDLSDFAKELSNLRLKEAMVSGKIPTVLSFLDMYKTSAIDDLNIYRRWLQNRTYESMRAMIGYKGADIPVYLDINEKYHGPHGLVAGTTGSGKSETLQTYILSLALNYHPQEVAFIIIDYKGGGMANSFEALPHLAGIITNLGGNQTNRALSSINSEIKRRQAVFSENRVKHIDEYIELLRMEKVKLPIPHLIIIADEFAELKKEQPEFVRALVSASRVGRSLGIHLILATQKPSGVVDDEIWGNSRFRICLRVQDKQDSNEMLKRSDAAYITAAGRGYFQVGNNEIFDEFQSGWSGAAYEPDVAFSDAKSNLVNMINLWGKSCNVPVTKSSSGQAKKKQLIALVEHINQVASHNHVTRVDQIWLPPLPSLVSVETIPWKKQKAVMSLPVVLGMVDDPINQKQFPYVFDVIEEGNLIINGSAMSGKTTLLQTLIYQLITSYTPQQVQFYIADFGSRTLRVFEKAPHVGGVVFDDDLERATKITHVLTKELTKRKTLLSSRGVGSYKEYIKRYSDLPAILFAVDNYTSFIENVKNQEEVLILLSREAASYGIYLIFTLTNLNDLRVRIRQNFNCGIGLQLSDKYEYESVINDKVEFLAEDKTPGRGFVKVGRALEFQTAICKPVEFADLSMALDDDLSERFSNYNGARAPIIPMVPQDLSVAWFDEQNQALMKQRSVLPIGYDVVESTPVSFKMSDVFCLNISGGPKSGKDNLYRFWLKVLLDRQEKIVVFDRLDRFSDLERKNITVIHDDEGLFDYCSSVLIPEFKKRGDAKVKYEAGQPGDFETYYTQNTPIYFFIKDMGYFLETIYKSKKDMKGFIEQMMISGRNYLIYFIAIVDSSIMSGEFASTRVFRNFISHKEGVYLGGNTDSQRLFEFEVPVSERSKKLDAGNGHTVINDKTIKVVIPRL